MFTDLRGFTKASATLSPSELIALIAEYQNVVLPVVRAHNGNIDKFMGDGILASFGAVNPSQQYAADALRCTEAILLASRNWATDRQARGLPVLGIGIGVAYGSLVFGIIGVERRLEYTVIGEPVNLAAKLEKHNKAKPPPLARRQACLNSRASRTPPRCPRASKFVANVRSAAWPNLWTWRSGFDPMA